MSKYYEEKKRDYLRLKELCGDNYVYDFCGGWCNNDVLDNLMSNPTKKNAAYYYSSLITTYFSRGFGLDCMEGMPDLLDHEVYEIAVRNGDI